MPVRQSVFWSTVFRRASLHSELLAAFFPSLHDLEAAPIGWQLFVRSFSLHALHDQPASLSPFETFATRLLAQALRGNYKVLGTMLPYSCRLPGIGEGIPQGESNPTIGPLYLGSIRHQYSAASP